MAGGMVVNTPLGKQQQEKPKHVFSSAEIEKSTPLLAPSTLVKIMALKSESDMTVFVRKQVAVKIGGVNFHGNVMGCFLLLFAVVSIIVKGQYFSLYNITSKTVPQRATV